MKPSHILIFVGSLIVGLGALGCSGQVEPSSTQKEAAPPPPLTSSSEDQARLASATLKLENVFSAQFAQGHIDRSELEGPIDDVLSATPEPARVKFQQHIEKIVDDGERLAPTLSRAEREELATPPPADKVGHTEQAFVSSWGWPGYAGWGGWGAFGFPGYSYGYGTGYGTSYGSAYNAAYSTAYGTGYGLGYGGLGYGGLGYGGWYY